MILLNRLKIADIVFLVVILIVVLITLAIYLLVPLLNKQRYQKQRDALMEREKIFKENLEKNQGTIIVKGKRVEDEQ